MSTNIYTQAAEVRCDGIDLLVFLAAETRPGPGWMETATNPGGTRHGIWTYPRTFV